MVRRFLVPVVVLVVMSSTLPVAAAPVFECSDIHMIWARGSKIPLDGFDFLGFDRDMRARMDPDLTYSTYQLGTDSGYLGFDYPAAGDFFDLVDAEAPPFPFGEYNQSVGIGSAELKLYMFDRARECPDELYVLGGWSQGAQVVGETVTVSLPRDLRDRIAYVALFGDPKLMSNLVDGDLSTCRGEHFPWTRGTSACWAPGGILERRVPYLPLDIEGRTGSWCNDGDGICTGDPGQLPSAFIGPNGFQDGVHFHYFDPRRDSAVAAREAALSLQQFLPQHSFDTTFLVFAAGVTGADLVFVIDTTGSMVDDIESVKLHAARVAELWLGFFPNARVALVQYRDHGDAFVARDELAFTDNVAAFESAVNGLTVGGGGDRAEAVLSGLMTAFNRLDFRAGAIKAALVIADAEGKDPELNPVTGESLTRVQVRARAREIDPVVLYALNVETAVVPAQRVRDWFRPFVEATDGKLFELEPGQDLAAALIAALPKIAAAPVAVLNGPYLAPVAAPILFSAAGSFDPDGQIVSYAWDFEADGIVDATTTVPTVEHAYASEFDGTATVRVTSSDGGTALAVTDVDVNNVGVTNLVPLPPTSVVASLSGANATITWTPAVGDRANGYKVYLEDGTVVGSRLAGQPLEVVVPIAPEDLPLRFAVASANGFGISSRTFSPTLSPPGSGDPCIDAIPTIVGTAGNDHLVGTVGADVIFGLGGHDWINGLDGNDVICGGDGIDVLIGGKGDDTANGGEGTDVIDTGSGNDQVVGGGGIDVLIGESGNDKLFGGDGADVLTGGSGDDTLDGGPGVDRIHGGSGTDLCEPEPKRVSCEGNLP